MSVIADPIVSRWKERERKGFLDRMKLLAINFFAVAFRSNDVLHLSTRSDGEREKLAPVLCARLKEFYTRRPRPWRTWRGSQRTGKRKYLRLQ